MRSRSNGHAAPVGHEPVAGQKGHRELRVWLRLLGCSVKMESILSQRLRKEFKTSLARFDVLAQLERFPDGLTMSDLSRRLIVSNGAITGLVDKAEELLGHSPHPAIVALPIGAWSVSNVCDALALATGNERYDDAARVSMAIGLIGVSVS
jgi:hypothetical protein